ncbi:hypothetical protein HK098_005548 [Nowakowskiella sp. JEL0407]|nr:hypothetical protein HK098_005548 [Nowakowskiella sp. JEL0407]
MISTLIILALIVLSGGANALLCDRTLKLSGKLKVIDGRTFQIINFSAENFIQDAQLLWTGRASGNSNVARIISDQTFYLPDGSGHMTSGPLFSFTVETGRESSFYDFTFLSLYSPIENNQLRRLLTGGNMTVPAIGEPPRYPAPAIPSGASQAPLFSSGSLQDWEFCRFNCQCKNGCCSNYYSNDGKYKCTPGASPLICTGFPFPSPVASTSISTTTTIAVTSKYTSTTSTTTLFLQRNLQIGTFVHLVHNVRTNVARTNTRKTVNTNVHREAPNVFTPTLHRVPPHQQT